MFISNVKPTSDVYNDNNVPVIDITFTYRISECLCPSCTSSTCPSTEVESSGTLRVYRDFKGDISFILEDFTEEGMCVYLDAQSRKFATEFVAQRFVVKPVQFVFDEPVYVPPVKNDFMNTSGYHTMNVNFINHTEYIGATIHIRDGKPTGAFDIRRIYPHHLRAYFSMFPDPSVMNDMWQCYNRDAAPSVANPWLQRV